MIFDKSIQNIEKIFDENIEKIFDENIEKIFDENIVLVKDDSEAWMNVEKTNLLQNSLSFLLSLQIDFPFKLPTLHPTQSFISISFQEQN